MHAEIIDQCELARIMRAGGIAVSDNDSIGVLLVRLHEHLLAHANARRQPRHSFPFTDHRTMLEVMQEQKERV
jgi:hypothetical protein